MKYALLIHEDLSSWEGLSQDEKEAIHRDYFAITEGPGIVGGEQLHPVETATTVRVKDGETLTTDGPFADTKEVFGGFYLFDVDDVDGALRIAERIPALRLGGSVEVRPLVEATS